MTLVEQAFRGFDDRRDDAGLRDDAAHRADGTLTRTLCDLADLELEPCSARERVPALVHGCRAGVRSLSAEGHLVALDAKRSQHDTEWQIQRLEHRPLLDVELEVGGGTGELAVRVECRVEVDIVFM